MDSRSCLSWTCRGPVQPFAFSATLVANLLPPFLFSSPIVFKYVFIVLLGTWFVGSAGHSGYLERCYACVACCLLAPECLRVHVSNCYMFRCVVSFQSPLFHLRELLLLASIRSLAPSVLGPSHVRLSAAGRDRVCVGASPSVT